MNFINGCWFHWAGDEAMARRFLNASVECASAVFLASSVTGEIEFPFDGEIIRAPAGPVAVHTKHTVAVETFLIAQIVRRPELLPPILEFPREQLDRRSSGEGDPFRLFLLDAFREYHSDPDNDAWRESLDEFERLCAPEFVPIAGPKYAAMYLHLAGMLRAIGDRDQAAFTEATIAAVKAHKAVFSRGERKRWVDGLIAIQALGLVALGVDSGLELEIETGYLSHYLVYEGGKR